jgi:putative intracellular protease/amidase
MADVASPGGGALEADRFDPKDDYNASALADPAARRALAATRATRTLSADTYAAVFIVGGKGAMFDLPADTALARLVAGVWDRRGVVSAVCHGPAANSHFSSNGRCVARVAAGPRRR